MVIGGTRAFFSSCVEVATPVEVTFTPATLILSSFLWTVVEEKVFVYIFSGKRHTAGF